MADFFEGKPFVIQGFEIPTDHPIFLSILGIHILAAMASVVSGIFAMLAKKEEGLHPKTGKIYFYSLLIVFITATLLAVSRWQEDYHLFILGAISFFSAFTGRRAWKRAWKKWPVFHISGMGLSYIFLLIAFYVDNGRFLPVWKELDPVVYWALPVVIGVPIIVRTLFRHPLSARYFRRG